MESEKLREACVLAGGALVEAPIEKNGATVRIWYFGVFGLHEGSPALLAYVAELLVEKARENLYDIYTSAERGTYETNYECEINCSFMPPLKKSVMRVGATWAEATINAVIAVFKEGGCPPQQP